MLKENSSILSTINHDLRSKIGNILNVSDILQDPQTGLNPKQKEMVDIIKNGASVVFDLLELLTHFERSDLSTIKQHDFFNPSEEFEYLVESFQRTSQILGINIEYSAEDRNYKLNFNIGDLRQINYMLVYLLITKVKNISLIRLEQSSFNNIIFLRYKFYYEEITKEVYNEIDDLYNYLDLNISRAYELIYESLLEIVNNYQIEISAFSSNGLLTLVELKFEVK